MSQENVELVRAGYADFRLSGRFDESITTDDFVWDMSNFQGWPEQPLYKGAEGARRFLEEWSGAWDDWELELEELHDAGDRVVAVMHQRGRSRQGGLEVDMRFAQVWTVRDGLRSRMEMYDDPAAALRAVGLAE